MRVVVLLRFILPRPICRCFFCGCCFKCAVLLSVCVSHVFCVRCRMRCLIPILNHLIDNLSLSMWILPNRCIFMLARVCLLLHLIALLMPRIRICFLWPPLLILLRVVCLVCRRTRLCLLNHIRIFSPGRVCRFL